MSFGIGIVGAGTIGNVHADAIERVGLNITGTWDVKPEAARKLEEKHPGIAVCASLDDLLARDDVDAVVVAIPNHNHAEAAIAAMKAGKDVLLEKPMAMNVAECDAIIDTMNETGRLLQMGFVLRQTSVARMVKQFIDEGQLGDIYHIKASVYRRRGIPGLGGWFTTKAISGGGALIDLGVHVIDLSMHLAGHPKPTRVSGAWYSMFGTPLES
ncbi:MAG: Gfo/Idh/MocA family protein, partial [Phycisphaerales bacterium JB038]